MRPSIGLFLHFLQVLTKSTGRDRLPYFPDGVKIKGKVVKRVQNGRKMLARHEEMTQIGSGVPAADEARTVGVQRSILFSIARVFYQHSSLAREKATVPRVSRWQDTVEHVDTTGHGADQIFRRAYPHQVTRPVPREKRRRFTQGFEHRLFGLSHAQTSDGEPGKGHFQQSLR